MLSTLVRSMDTMDTPLPRKLYSLAVLAQNTHLRVNRLLLKHNGWPDDGLAIFSHGVVRLFELFDFIERWFGTLQLTREMNPVYTCHHMSSDTRSESYSSTTQEILIFTSQQDCLALGGTSDMSGLCGTIGGFVMKLAGIASLHFWEHFKYIISKPHKTFAAA
ncbi:hypothetical protein E2P81_ATG01405 [Venturia nashicola]|uniref:Uncharacterized protein n=1 Tax=Venturia nashicola TaxID=86259 RepID=A0A4Z1PGZ6_9PEZI|nr:hypothetical protein E6O75_ATG01437 [Venturia nashicola]TLD38862.1 hypothetical protein E2P81_ATG01405 [Venturia nashicola]